MRMGLRNRCTVLIVALMMLALPILTVRAESADGYTQIDQDTAKEMMSRVDGHVVVDVRRKDEYDSGHIPGAVLIPNESIEDELPLALPDLDQIILIYCRSGNRSKQASEKLAVMGYTNIYEFGGINTWTGEIVTAKEEAPALVLFSLHRSGDAFFDSYRITRWQDGYRISVSDGNDQYIDDDSVEALMQVIEKYDVAQWDGFSGTDEYVLDGEGFWIQVILTDGTTITASGENEFPENYFPAIGDMQDILDRAEITPTGGGDDNLEE